MTLPLKHDTLILDAACVINLYASGKMAEILGAVPAEITIAAYVAEKEALRIRGTEEDQQIDLKPMVDDGLITIVTFDTEEEEETALSIAAVLDQGEADTGAIAIHRDWAMATDDRKARNLLAAKTETLQLIYTLDIVKHWADVNNIASAETKTVLQNIRTSGRYQPRKSNPHYEWWKQLMT